MKKVAAIVFSYYPADPRPRREAEALIDEGFSVDLICLKGPGEFGQELVNGVHVYRLPVLRKRSTKLSYVFEYGIFILLAFFRLATLNLRKRYNVIHIHNMPDILVLTSLIPRLMGAKIVLDLHDPMPEVYMTKYKIGASHPAIRLLIFLEKFSIGFADLVLTPNKAFSDVFVSRGCPREKLHIVMNSPQESIFSRKSIKPVSKANVKVDQFAIMYHGTIVERHGLDVALGAVNLLQRDIPNLVFHVYGDGDFVPQFLRLCKKLSLEKIVKYHGRVPLEAIAEAIKTMDVGIVPNKRSVFTEINLPTRIFEYLAMGKSVVVPRTKGIQDYFDEKSIHFIEADNLGSLADAILNVVRDPRNRETVLRKGIQIYRKHRWEIQKGRFVNLIKDNSADG